MACFQFLDISGHTEAVSEEGSRSLYRVSVGGELWPSELCGSLHHLLLGGPGGRRLEPGAVAGLLLQLPLLVNLGSYPSTGEAVSQLLRRERGRVLGLRYIHDQATGGKVWKKVRESCHNLETVFLDTPEAEVMDCHKSEIRQGQWPQKFPHQQYKAQYKKERNQG